MHRKQKNYCTPAKWTESVRRITSPIEKDHVKCIKYEMEYKRHIEDEAIYTFCEISPEDPVSIDVINGMLHGPNMLYPCLEVAESYEAFHVLKKDMLLDFNQNKRKLLFFEDRKTQDSNVIVAVTHQAKEHGRREHIISFYS